MVSPACLFSFPSLQLTLAESKEHVSYAALACSPQTLTPTVFVNFDLVV
uniref:Uncharacterized protein n=1 Tax=Anguilla anguilla TaxID=7936 RepID=A0A0E9XTW6_ANGAN